MTRSTTFIGTKSASGIATKSLALGALGLVAFGVVAAAPAATAAPSTGGGIAPMVEWSSDYATIFTNFAVDSYSPKGPGGEMLWNTVMSTSFDMAIPNDAAAGDTFKLTIPGDDFRFTNFTDLEIATPSGTVVAKASTLNSKNVIITLTEAVESSQNLVGKATLTTTPLAGKTAKEATFLVKGADGANLGPNNDYTINPVGNYSTNLGVQGRILPGNELGLRVSHNYAGKVSDLSTVHTTIKTNTPGAIPLCEGTEFPIHWMTEGHTVLVDSGLTAVVESCDPVTGEMVVGFPAGASMPAEADGFTIFTYWVADTPSKDYDFQWDSNINGQQLNRVGNGRSPVLDGAINGQVRPAKTVVTKTSDAPERLMVGDVVPYTITTTNVEAIRTALGISTVDTLPAGTEFVSATDGGVYDAATHTITWPTVDYLAGQARAYKVDVKVLDASADLVTNKVTNTGINTCFEGDNTGSICEASVSDPLVRPGLEFDKKALPVVDVNENGVVGDKGDKIPYKFVVTNDGNTAEASFTFNDELLGIKDQLIELEKPLEPGASYTLPGDYFYEITEEDVDAEKVVNTASVSVPGLPPVTDTVETPTKPVPPAPTTTPVPAKPEPVKDVSLATTGSELDMAPLALAALGVLAAGGTAAAIAHKRGRKGSAAKNQG